MRRIREGAGKPVDGCGAVRIVALLVCLCALGGCVDRDPIRVGFVGSLTGSFADLGVPGRNGALMAVEALNAQGGVNGRRVELVVCDDESTVEGALRWDLELIRSGVRVLIGHMTSSQTEAALPLVEKEGAVLISPTASSSAFDGKKDALFRLLPSDSEQTRELARYIHEVRGLGTAAVVWDSGNAAFAENYAQGFVQMFRLLGGRVPAVLEMKAERKDADWISLAVAVKAARSDAVLIVASPRDTARLCQELARQGAEAALFASLWSRSQDLVLFGGRRVEGLELVQVLDMDRDDPAAVEFKEKYRERFGKEPGFAAYAGHDAVLLAAHALQKDPKESRLRSLLAPVNGLKGVTGPVVLDPYGDRIRSCFVERLEGGRFVRIDRTGVEG